MRSNTTALNQEDLDDLISEVQLMSISNKNASNLSRRVSNMSEISINSGSSSIKSKLNQAIKRDSTTHGKVEPVKPKKKKNLDNSNTISSIMGESSYNVNPEEQENEQNKNTLFDKFKEQLSSKQNGSENNPVSFQKLNTKIPGQISMTPSVYKNETNMNKLDTQVFNLHVIQKKFTGKTSLWL